MRHHKVHYAWRSFVETYYWWNFEWKLQIKSSFLYIILDTIMRKCQWWRFLALNVLRTKQTTFPVMKTTVLLEYILMTQRMMLSWMVTSLQARVRAPPLPYFFCNHLFFLQLFWRTTDCVVQSWTNAPLTYVYPNTIEICNTKSFFIWQPIIIFF